MRLRDQASPMKDEQRSLVMRFLTLSALATALIAGAACTGAQKPQATAEARSSPESGAPAVPVAAASAVERPMPLELQVIGRVEATNVSVRSQVTGELQNVNFKEGDDVAKGQVLFQVDRRPLEAALKQAEANLERDRAQAEHADAQARRYDDLARRGIATREQVETAHASAEALRATVGADRAAVENAKLQLQYATILAPTSGR